MSFQDVLSDQISKYYILERCKSSFCNETLRIFVNNPSCFVLSHTRGLTGWSWFHFAAVSSILLGLWSTVCSQVSRESILSMGGFSLKLVEVCQGFQLKKDSRVFVVRKFIGKILGFLFPLSHWCAAGHRRLPIIGLPALH